MLTESLRLAVVPPFVEAMDSPEQHPGVRFALVTPFVEAKDNQLLGLEAPAVPQQRQPQRPLQPLSTRLALVPPFVEARDSPGVEQEAALEPALRMSAGGSSGYSNKTMSSTAVKHMQWETIGRICTLTV